MINNVGYIFALLSAISFALGTIFFKKMENEKHHIHPFIINLFKNSIGFILITIILFSFNFPVITYFFSENSIVDKVSIGIIILSGIIGMGVAELLYIHTLSFVNTNIIAVIGSTLSIFIFTFSVLLASIYPHYFPAQKWPPNIFEISGFIFIITAIIISSWNLSGNKNNNNSGVILVIIAILLMGLSATLTNSVISQVNNHYLTILYILWIRFIPGIFVSLFFIKINKDVLFSDVSKTLSNKTNLFYLTLGSIMFSFLAVSFMFIGMSFETNNIAIFSILAQTSNLFIFLLGWLLLKEKIDAIKILGIIVSFLGIILIVIGR